MSLAYCFNFNHPVLNFLVMLELYVRTTSLRGLSTMTLLSDARHLPILVQ